MTRTRPDTADLDLGLLPEHIRRNFAAADPHGCWLWTRSLNRGGYGLASLKGHTYQAHRLVYRLLIGDPPAGLVLDHLCRVRHCVNPDHLEPVTPAENLRRSELTPAGMVRCKMGHELVVRGRQRLCIVCKADYQRRRRAAGAA